MVDDMLDVERLTAEGVTSIAGDDLGECARHWYRVRVRDEYAERTLETRLDDTWMTAIPIGSRRY